MITEFDELRFYHYLLSNYELCRKANPSLFKFGGGKLSLCFKYAKQYLEKYQCAPTEKDLLDIARMHGDDDKLTESFLTTVYLNKDAYKDSDEQWMKDSTIAWAEWVGMGNTLIDTVSYYKKMDAEITPENVKDFKNKAVSIFNTGVEINFDEKEDSGKDFWTAKDHSQKHMERRSSGYDFIDMCLGGGYWSGSFTVFVGQPKIGKSNFLCNLAVKSVIGGYNTAYISLELPEEMLMARMGSNMLNIPISSYDSVSENVDELQKRMSQYRSRVLVQPGELYVKSFGTSTMTTQMLEATLKAEEQRRSALYGTEFHFHNVFIDYINIMCNYRNPSSENTYMKIKQLAEDTKAVCIRNDWAGISATQTGRQQADTNDMCVSDVAESHALLATVDCMFGIIADVYMKARGEYYLKCLADRVSPQDNKRKTYLLDKNYLRISEDINSPIVEVTSAVDSEIEKFRKNKKNGTQYGPQQPIQSGSSGAPVIDNPSQPQQTAAQQQQENITSLIGKPSENDKEVNPNVGQPMKLLDTSLYNEGQNGGMFRNIYGLR
jgi:archaellum biogenesis ATPase FlaH